MRIKDKIALITGSSSGIGQAIAIQYAKEGANIVIDYIGNKENAEDTLRHVESLGRKGLIVRADISKIEEVKRLVQSSIDHFGRLDILVNNAGVESNAPFWEVAEEEYDRVLNINLKGVFFTTQAFVKHLMETNRKGKIINISSVHEELPFPHFAAYCASKGGLKMLTRNLSVELAPLGITINSIAPGAIETPINSKLLHDSKELSALISKIPLGRLGQTSDVAGLAVFLASSDSDYVTGSTYFVDGGLTWNYKEQ